MSKKRLAFLVLIIVSLLWATAGITAKTLIHDVDPLVAGFWRFFIASLIITPFFLRERHTPSAWKQLLIPSLIGALNVPLYFLGIKTTTANSATLIYTAAPLTTAILSYFLIRERNSVSKWIGIFLGLIGVSIIVFLPLVEQGKAMTGDIHGNLLMVSGMLSWTIYAIISRKLRMKKQFSPTTMTSIYFYLCSLVCFSLLLITRQPLIPQQLTSIPYLFVLLYSAIFITLITYFLFQWVIEHLSATTASFKQYIETLFAVILNYLFLGEKMTLGFILGGLLIVMGLITATLGKLHTQKNK